MAQLLDLDAAATMRRAPRAAVRRPLDDATAPPQCDRSSTGLKIRALGLALICIAILAIRMLVTLVHVGPAHPATALEFAIAFVAVGAALPGNLLLWQGAGVTSACAVSGRICCARR